ncbi:MAG TPA: HEAT repeat domain-containing protein, partial [Myxococcaceae bacterium]|nr:HEAT repeat domain-containing protein [Myxococcaceae bacterium]
IVRAEAAAALGRRGEKSSTDLLAELLEDSDQSVQSKAAVALAQLGGDQPRARLSARYARAGRSTRTAIVQALRAAAVPKAMAEMVSAEAAALWARHRKALEDGSSPERAAAAQELGRSGRPEAITRLLALARQSSPSIAPAAVRGLAEAADPSAAAPLAKLLDEKQPELRAAVCDAFGRLGDADAAPLLQAVALEASSASPFAIAALISLPPQPAVNQLLCEVAARAAPAEAVAAARQMRSRGGCSLTPLLENLPASGSRAPKPGNTAHRPADVPRSVETSLQVLAALGRTAQGAQSRISPLLGDRDPAVRLAALDAAAELRASSLAGDVAKAYGEQLGIVSASRAKWIPGPLSKEYAPGFTRDAERLSDETAPKELAEDVPDGELLLLASAVRALGMVGAPEALTVAKALAADPSTPVRAAAYAAAAYSGQDGVAQAAQGLSDVRSELRGSVATALVDQGAPGVTAVLAHLDPKRGGSLELLQALARAPFLESAVDKLAPFLNSGAAEGVLAATLIGKMPARGAVAPLLKYLEDPLAAGRRQAVMALGEIGDLRAADAIARALYDESPELRAAAAQALGRLGGTSHVEELEALKGDYYANVRRAAQGALQKPHSVSEVR